MLSTHTCDPGADLTATHAKRKARRGVGASMSMKDSLSSTTTFRHGVRNRYVRGHDASLDCPALSYEVAILKRAPGRRFESHRRGPKFDRVGTTEWRSTWTVMKSSTPSVTESPEVAQWLSSNHKLACVLSGMFVAIWTSNGDLLDHDVELSELAKRVTGLAAPARSIRVFWIPER